MGITFHALTNFASKWQVHLYPTGIPRLIDGERALVCAAAHRYGIRVYVYLMGRGGTVLIKRSLQILFTDCPVVACFIWWSPYCTLHMKTYPDI